MINVSSIPARVIVVCVEEKGFALAVPEIARNPTTKSPMLDLVRPFPEGWTLCISSIHLVASQGSMPLVRGRWSAREFRYVTGSHVTQRRVTNTYSRLSSSNGCL